MAETDEAISPEGLRRALARIDLALVNLELARVSHAHFAEAVFGWKAGAVPMHGEWDDHIEGSWTDGKNAGIQAPRDHGKTMQVAISRTILELGQSTVPELCESIPWIRPGLRIKIFQNADINATKSIILIRTIIEQSKTLRAIFPDLRRDPDGEWSQHRLTLRTPAGAQRGAWERDPNLEGAAVMSHATSGRGDIIKLDDICDLDNSVLEPATRPKILESFDAVIFHLREPWTRFADIGTAWHEEDANAVLQKRPSWRWRIYRIQDEPDGPMKVLWPGKWTLEALRDSYDNSPREFERGFNNRAYTKGEKAFSWDAIKACFDDTIAPGEFKGPTPVRVAGYDLATSLKDDASRFVAFVLGMTPDKKFVPLEIIRGQVSVPTQEDTVVRMQERWEPHTHRVENNAYQDALVQYLAARTDKPKGLRVEGYMTGKQKLDPMIGVPSLAPSFEAGQWIIPTKGGHDGQGACPCPYCTWLRELKNFPAGLIDTVMGCWFAFDKIRALTPKPPKPKGYGERQFKRARMPRDAI